MTRSDARKVRRLVGFLEYGKALDYFDELLRKVTDDELAVIDEIVSENDAFTIYTDLSRGFHVQPASLSGRSSADSTPKRRGLAWVMALARVEFGAMLATFTGIPNPFEAVRPSTFEFEAYKDFLAEGATTHYRAMSRDPDLKRVARTSPVNPIVLSYSRRLVLARAMLRAAIKSGISELSPYQFRELASWKNDLDAIQAGLVLKIQSYLMAETRAASPVTRSKSFQDACGAMLRAEKRELKRGTAQIKTYTGQ